MLNRRVSFPIIVAIIVIGYVFLTVASAQTTLVTGDIAFSGYKCNDAVPDQFSFVLLRNITANTVIKFSDYGWYSDVGAFSNATVGITESELVFTATSALSAGQEITIVGTTVTIVNPASGTGTAVYTVAAPFLVGNLSLASNGDQIIAYQGNFPTPTTFIAGIHMNVNVFANPGDPPTTTAAAWDGLVPLTFRTNNPSALPTGLITYTNANWFGTAGDITSERDNVRFVCGSTPIGTVAQVRTALNSGNVPANWLANNTNPSGFTLPTGCSYLAAPSAANASISGRVLTANGIGIRNAAVIVTGGNLPGPRFATTGTFGYYNFEGLEVGQTYVVTVQSKRFAFLTPDIILTLQDNVLDANFVAFLD
jgi:hypothetical protein